MPVRRLIITMSIPMMISMLVQALYNVVDSIFVARLSEDALTAVTLAFPLQNFMIAVCSGTGVGVNALLSKSLGEKRFDRSDKAANTAIFLSFCNFAAFALIGLTLAGTFIHSQTKDPAVTGYGITYLRIVMAISPGLSYQIMFERLLQSTGRTVHSMISQISGAVINIILDPIMIFGYFGCPALGVAGAAYATVIGQSVAALIGLFLNLRFNQDIRIRMELVVKPDRKTISRIYQVGIPTILMMSIGSVMTYLMNRILITFSNTATAVFGVYFKLQSFFFMPIFGLNNGLIPVLAYNFGARKRDRINEALKFSTALAMGIMLTGTFIFNLFPNQLLDLFNAHEEMRAIGVSALRTISLSFPIAAVCIIMGSTFQAFSKSIYSLIVSVARQLVALIPAAWLLAQTGVVSNVWFAFIIAEVMSLIISGICFRKLYRDIVARM